MKEIILPKVDGPASQGGTPQGASEMSSTFTELLNIVTRTGQTPTNAFGVDDNQIGKGIAAYSTAGDFYTSSGAVNSFVLSPNGSMVAPPEYIEGMEVRFIPTTTNTGASTINVASIGVVPLVNEDGSPLSPGRVVSGVYAKATYSSAINKFKNIQQLNTPVAELTFERIQGYNDVSVAVNTILLSLADPDEIYPSAYFENQYIHFFPQFTNTNATTVKIGSLPVTGIVKVNGDPIDPDSIVIGTLAKIIYKGTNFILVDDATPDIVSKAKYAKCSLPADQVLPFNTYTKLNFSVDIDTFNLINTGLGRIQSTTKGTLEINFATIVAPSTSSDVGFRVVFYLYKNGVKYFNLGYVISENPDHLEEQHVCSTFIDNSLPTDYYEIFAISVGSSLFDAVVLKSFDADPADCTILTVKYIGN